MDSLDLNLQSDIRRVLHYLQPHDVPGWQKLRLGSDGDGGYIMLDRFTPGGSAYSIGIGGDVNWDLAMAERGFVVHQYDHTISGPPITHAALHFNRVGIASSAVDGFTTIPASIIANGDAGRCDLILKIDIEDAEWAVFDALDDATLAQFSQILVEFHGLHRLGDVAWLPLAARVFQRLARSHAVFHVHANNWGEVRVVEGIPVPEVIEISYVRRDVVRLALSTELFPTALDMPNTPHRPEIFLGSFRFL